MNTYNAMLGPGTGTGGGFNFGGAFASPTGTSGPGMQNLGGGPSFPGPQGGMQAPMQGGGLGNVTANYINNPFGNPFFQTQQQLGTRQAQNIGGTNISNLFRNFQTGGGLGGSSGTLAPFQQEQLANMMRSNTGLQAQLGFLNPVQNALGLQQNAMGLAANYRPLQIGGKSTESTGGLGTWLPQVAGMGLGLATGGLGGGLGSLFGGGGSSLPAGGSSDMMNTAMSAFNNANPSYTGVGSLPMPSGAGFFPGGSGITGPYGGGGGMPPPPMPGPGGGWMSS